MKQVIILIGAPGSGKGTLASLLKDHYHLPHISTGDLFRKEISLGTDLGNNLKSLLSSGSLIDDKITTELLLGRLEQSDCKNGFVLDGYPRSFNQVLLLDDILEKLAINSYKVIEISVPEDIIVKRITGRYSCVNCGTNYNKYFNLPKKEGVCNVCSGSEFSVREDDNEESLKKRLELFHAQFQPIVNFYKKKNKHNVLHGNTSLEELETKIVELIN